MSARTKIVNALVEKFKLINGSSPYRSNLFGNVSNKLKFWDEIHDYPFVCMSAGDETREYLPAGFKWGFLNITIRIYVQDEDPTTKLEEIFEDIEYVLDNNNSLEYSTNRTTTEISILQIMSDEGVMAPLGIGEVLIQVRYDV